MLSSINLLAYPVPIVGVEKITIAVINLA